MGGWREGYIRGRVSVDIIINHPLPVLSSASHTAPLLLSTRGAYMGCTHVNGTHVAYMRLKVTSMVVCVCKLCVLSSVQRRLIEQESMPTY